MKNWRYLIILFILTTFTAYSGEDRIDSILQLAGLQPQVESTAELTASSIRKFSFVLTSPAAEKYEKTIASSYEKKKVFLLFRKSFEEKMKGVETAGIEKWLSSPLAKKITELEKKALAPEAAAGFKEYITGTLRLDKKRKELVRKFLNVTSSDEMSEKMVCEPLRAMMNSLQDRLPQDMKEDQEDFKEELDELENETLIEYRMLLSDSVAFTYRELSDEEFSRMLDFYGTEDGRKFNSIVIDSMVSALKISAAECGKGMAELLVEARKRTGGQMEKKRNGEPENR